MTTAKPATRKTATPRKRAVKATQTAPETPAVAQVDPDVYVAPTGLSDGFESNGSIPLDRLTARALENLTELATEGDTPQSRKYWTNVLARYGVSVPELVSA